MRQPVPNVAPADVERIVRRDFPEQVEHVMEILRDYGAEDSQREVDRVRLAILKLANGDLQKLRQQLNVAKCDYRDVLAPAEYPGYLRAAPALSLPANADQNGIVSSDWEQYDVWFSR
jgi:hypothetical protein